MTQARSRPEKAVDNKCCLSKQASVHDMQCCIHVFSGQLQHNTCAIPAHAAVSFAVAQPVALQQQQSRKHHRL